MTGDEALDILPVLRDRLPGVDWEYDLRWSQISGYFHGWQIDVARTPSSWRAAWGVMVRTRRLGRPGKWGPAIAVYSGADLPELLDALVGELLEMVSDVRLMIEGGAKAQADWQVEREAEQPVLEFTFKDCP